MGKDTRTQRAPYADNKALFDVINPVIKKRFGSKVAFLRASAGQLDHIRWDHLQRNRIWPEEREVRVAATLLGLDGDALWAFVPPFSGHRRRARTLSTRQDNQTALNNNAADAGKASAAA